MKYENDMRILYDVVSKGVLIQFRGKTEFLEGPFPDRREAIKAAKEYCRRFGWAETPPK